MQDRHLFEYAIIRVVPRVEREEFINVGVILYCATLKFLDVVYEMDESRLMSLCAKSNLIEIAERLEAFRKICSGGKSGGEIGKLPMASRFRWLTANRSTIVQTSAVHPGLCKNAGETLDQLFQKLVK